jgi:hypothetical protein
MCKLTRSTGAAGHYLQRQPCLALSGFCVHENDEASASNLIGLLHRSCLSDTDGSVLPRKLAGCCDGFSIGCSPRVDGSQGLDAASIIRASRVVLATPNDQWAYTTVRQSAANGQRKLTG